MIPVGVAVALENGVIRVYDTNLAQNLMFEVVVGKEIVQF
jgi:hypothetical protein